MVHIQILKQSIFRFRADQAGSVATDVMILAASLIGIAATVMGSQPDGAEQMASNDDKAIVAYD